MVGCRQGVARAPMGCGPWCWRRGLGVTVLAVAMSGLVAGCSADRSVPAEESTRAAGASSAERVMRASSLLATPAWAQSLDLPEGSSLSDVAEEAVERVVNISTNRLVRARQPQARGPFGNDPLFDHFFGRPMPERRERSLGSGVIVSADGLVLTNNHVVQDAEEIRVTLSDGTPLTAEVVGTDPPSDLAVLRLQGEFEELPWMVFGDSDRLRLGEVVLAVGNPFGLDGTVTMGIVSAKGRSNVGIVDYEDFIQTDASINPGNSGGALINMRGELVGINTAILSRSGGYQGIGFAIPSRMAQSLMQSLVDHGRVVRGYLGVAIQDLDEALARALDVDARQGVVIAGVEPDTPAQAAGLREGDVVIAMDGQPVSGASPFRNQIALAPAGTVVELTLIRDGREQTVPVTLGEREDPASAAVEPVADALGLRVESLTSQHRERFRITPRVEAGAVVVEVLPGSRAARAGLRPGDVVIEANRRPVRGVDAFHAAVGDARGQVLVRVVRGGAALFAVIP